MPAWLREPDAEPSLVARFGRQALMWAAALVAVGAVAAGAMYLRKEQKAHSELDAIAMSSRTADAAVISAVPPETVVPAPRNITVPPLVTLPPEEGKVATPPVPAALTPANTTPPDVKTVDATPAVKTVDVTPAVKPAAKPAAKPASKPALAKTAPKPAARATARTLTAAKWPPSPSRKLPLAQNVVPKPKGKALAGQKGKVMAAAPKKGAKPLRTAAVKPKVQPKAAQKRVAGVMLPAPKQRATELPAPREYPRDPVPIPRSCAKGELARDCAN